MRLCSTGPPCAISCRVFWIQKLRGSASRPVEQNLMFAGHAAFRFKSDPFYSNGFVPTVKQLVDRILTGA